MAAQPILINGEWVPSKSTKTFQAVNPATNEPATPHVYPVSTWEEIDAACHAAHAASVAMRAWPGERFAQYLEAFATRIEARATELVTTGNLETAYPVVPRLKDVELPRTINQLRQAAAAARDGSWAMPVIDTAAGIRSMYGPIGPCCVFGPNNFPFAFNGAAGGDFAAAVAAGNPVIAKGHSSHPRTTQIFVEEAHQAARETNMPAAMIQLIYRTSHEDGYKLVAHPRLAATGYTGARATGLKLMEAARSAGKQFFAELSSVNPVFMLPGALHERKEQCVQDFVASNLLGVGQFCTNPGVVVLQAGKDTEAFIADVKAKFEAAPVGTMLGPSSVSSFQTGVETLIKAGAEMVTGGKRGGGKGCCFNNTLLRTTGKSFIANPDGEKGFQTEIFGNGALLVVADTAKELVEICDKFEGNLTGCIYSDTKGADDVLYSQVASELRTKVGRLLNDKMPTGVAVSPAMNHGGPYPATGSPQFTAVGIPASMTRWASLWSYDAVRPERLPLALQDRNPNGVMFRKIDGKQTQGDVPPTSKL